jgi:AMP phosphorylase
MDKKLIPKRIPIKVGTKYIAILNEKTAQELELRVADRILLKVNGKKELTAILDITTPEELKNNQIGLYAETWQKMDIKKGDRIEVSIAPKPPSNAFIKKKLNGKKLSQSEIHTIIRDVVRDDLSDIEMTYFVAGCFTMKLDDEETANLTKAIAKYGDRIEFKDKIVMDKHCIGGVPGNRTTMLIIPIITSLGYVMPKTSSRAITSPAGTADTMEVMANVENDADRLKEIAEEVGGFIAWGGGVDLAAADDKLIRVRYPLKLDPQGMLLASIMAKKYSVSSNHVIIDIPMGPQGKTKTKQEANQLKKRFLSIAKLLDMNMVVVITSADQPVGYGIGPVLECLDVIKILKNEKDAPKDLKEKAIMMCNELLYLTGKYTSKKAAEKKVREAIDSGEAYKQLMRIVEAQGKKKMKKVGEFTHDVKAKSKGKVLGIHNKIIASIARTAGAPKDAGAGVYIYKKIGDEVEKGEKLFTVYSESETRLKHVKKMDMSNAYKISNN